LVSSRRRKKVTAAFDGGRLLVTAERRIGIAHRLTGLIADPLNPLLVTHGPSRALKAARQETISRGTTVLTPRR
jgi:hypothetical protein